MLSDEPHSNARLPIPVSGISISRSLFFVPAHDSSGFLWILVFSGGIFSQEPPFGRGKKIPVFGHVNRNFTQVPVYSCIWPGFLQIPPESSGFLRNSSGIPVPAKSRLGTNWVAQLVLLPWDVMIGPPHPLDTHSTSILYIFKAFYILYMWLVSIWMQLNIVIAWPTPTPNHSQQYMVIGSGGHHRWRYALSMLLCFFQYIKLHTWVSLLVCYFKVLL